MPSIFHMEANLGISLHFPVTLSIRNLSAFSISFASAFTDAEINWFSLFFRESHSIQQQCSSLIPQQYQQFLSFRFLFWLIFFLFFRCFRCQGKKKPWKTAFVRRLPGNGLDNGRGNQPATGYGFPPSSHSSGSPSWTASPSGKGWKPDFLQSKPINHDLKEHRVWYILKE